MSQEIISDTLYGVGLIWGVLLALILWQFLLFFVAPAAEWLTEKCLGERPPEPETPDFSRACAVFLTDLHVDTWPLKDNTDKTQDFDSFVSKLLERPNIEAIYFGGDFADIPLHPNFFPQPPLLELGTTFPEIPVHSTLEQTQEPRQQVMRLAAQKRVAGIIGNHELGITGVRLVNKTGKGMALWNPAIQVTGHESGPLQQHIYIEHGHRFDPLLWLYLRYAVLDLLRQGYGEGAPPIPPLTERKLRDRLEKAVPGADSKLPTREIQADQRTLGEWLILLRYRWFARGALRAIQRDKNDYTQIKTFLCGHTHAPDRWEFKNGSVYINGGDWCGNTPHRSFCLIDTEGVVHGPFDFSH